MSVSYEVESESGAVYLACGECEAKPAVTRGLCRTCYQQARRGGYLDDYPIAQVYDRDWVENTLPHIIAIHGRGVLDEALAVHEVNSQC